MRAWKPGPRACHHFADSEIPANGADWATAIGHFNLTQTTGALTYTATTGPNSFVLQEDSSGLFLEILDNKIVVASAPLADVTSVSITGAANNDNSLTINYGNGLFTQAVTFDGGVGTGTHKLILEAATVTNEVYAPTGAHSGAVAGVLHRD